jgi:ATP-dependent protease ClpP protease subunit
MLDRPNHSRALALMAAAAAEEGAIWIIGEIDQNVERNARIEIARAHRKSTPIAGFIDSPGGCLASARRIAEDLRKATGGNFEAFAGLECSSAAILPFIAASQRTALRGTQFFLHRSAIELQPREYARADAPFLRSLADQLAGLDEAALIDTILGGGRLSAAMRCAAREPRGLRLTAMQALMIGLIHNVRPRPTAAEMCAAATIRRAPLAALRIRGC